MGIVSRGVVCEKVASWWVSRVVTGDSPVGLGARTVVEGGNWQGIHGVELCGGQLTVFEVCSNLSVCLLKSLVGQWAREKCGG